ncbi:MAG TPA: GIY-YIG nuclease family protein [Anaerolineae bacterium]|nr:GIY-YIG nuclease family protein [Anaerolineae bacterium]HQJ50443.1 GIY-YIG nuclease family protein [Anaerolineae bacterium]
MKPDQWPATPGTYALVLELPRSARVRIGRLGTFRFPAGCYIYVGSALGPGGLRARLERHCRRRKKMHWHIDYLLARARIAAVRHDASGERLECAWARNYEKCPGVSIIVPGFGASDCSCRSHLFYRGSSPLETRGPIGQALDCADPDHLSRPGDALQHQSTPL